MPLSHLEDDLYMALKSWHQHNPQNNPLDYLQLFRQARPKESGDTRQVINEILLEGLKVLEVEHKEDAELLRRRFLDGMAMRPVANRFNIGEATAYRRQKEAIRRLSRILETQELEARETHRLLLEKRLGAPPAAPLIGIERQLQTLLKTVSSSAAPWLVSIEGLGGIGKTALAYTLSHQPDLTSHFYDVAWVSAKQQEFLPGHGLETEVKPALSVEALIDALLEQLDETIPRTQPPAHKRLALLDLLKQAPYFIIIDNLETIEDYQTLLPALRQLVNPSKVLLTSRHSLRACPEIFCLTLSGFDQANTVRFIRQEAELRGLSILANASEAQLKSIHQVVGGNPLALRLVVGQVSMLPLSRVLENLRQSRGRQNNELYTHIYWQAWRMLDQISQQIFLCMPLAQNGTLEQLLALSQLEVEPLCRALKQLIRLSLVQDEGNLEERRYMIHRLTETFLLQEAIKWRQSA